MNSMAFTNQEYIFLGVALIIVLIFVGMFGYFINLVRKSQQNRSGSRGVMSEQKQLEEQKKQLDLEQEKLEKKLIDFAEAPIVKNVVAKKELKKVKSDLPALDEEIEDYSDAKGFNVLKDRKSKLSAKYWKDWWVERKFPASTALVHMELLNGFHKIFLVREKDAGFKYNGKKYLFDNSAKYYLLDSKLWAYDYHEIFSLPIKRSIPVTEIRKTMEASGISDVEYATNPKTLEEFAVSKIAEGIMRGAELDTVFKFLRLVSIIILVVVTIHFLLFAQKSGIFDQVTNLV